METKDSHLNLKLLKNKHQSLSSICPWITFADPEKEILYLKGGAICCAYEFIAPDIDSSSDGKINTISTMINNAVVNLGENWTVQFELQRSYTNKYPGSSFNNLAGFMIEKQRELNFLCNQNHFHNRYFIVFTYYLPNVFQNKAKKLIVNNSQKNNKSFDLKTEVKTFKMKTSKIARILSTIMYVEKLVSNEFIKFIHSSVSLNWHDIAIPDDYNILLDNIVTDSDLQNSMPLKLGDYYIPILNIRDFPSSTIPAMFDALNKAQCELRWSTRFMCYSKQEANKIIEAAEKKFHSARKSVGQLVMESTLHTESTRENSTSIAQEDDASVAKVELAMGNMGYGSYVSNVMVWDKKLEAAEEKLKEIDGLVSSIGFTCKEETLNCLPAFCSMMPGNIYANKRDLFVSSGNLSHVVPISSIWSGLHNNNFMKDICGQKHPHVICDTDFGMPYYLNLNIRDVGHTWISGVTGAGKSTLLALLEAQWLKYPNSQVIIFDKDRSARNLTMCVGGIYLEPGLDDITFQPLAEIDDFEGQTWAAEFIEILLTEQKVTVTAAMRKAIFDTIKLLSTKDIRSRTLTSFQQYCDYQNPDTHNNDIVDGIAPYCLGGQYGKLFDSDYTNFKLSSWTMIEMGSLMKMAQGAVTPALDYLFRQSEKLFTGFPTLLVLDEAWLYFKNEIFAEKIVEWLKTLRKKHVFVVFATQEIDDAANSPIASTLVSQCVSKIYLADPDALTPLKREAYKKFGLEESEINKLSRMIMKEDYFYKSSMGTRCFQLGLDRLQLGILTNSIDDMDMLDEIEAEYGKNTGKELVKVILDAKEIDYSYLLED